MFSSLTSNNLNLVWQSYAQMKTLQTPLMVESAQGIYLNLDNGRKLIDGISSWWTTCHGHAHPFIVNKVKQQLEQLPHIIFAGLAHKPAYLLAQKLLKILPYGLQHFLYCESGSVAVETAMKIALQYFSNKNINKKKFLYFENGYHGDTFGCSIVTDNTTPAHNFIKSNHNSLKALVPKNTTELQELESIIKKNKDDLIAVIIEPLCQSAGGMKFHKPEILAEIYKITKKHGLLFIADEIATGFYRTGKYFGCNHAEITPDILCLGKAITSGVVPFAAVAVTEEVFFSFYSNDENHTLKHSSTFAANPLGCIASIGSIELFEKEPRMLQVSKISTQLQYELKSLKNHSKVKDIRVLGAIGVVELDCTYNNILAMRSLIREKNVWLRPFGNVIYTMPPFITNENEISIITKTISEIITEIFTI
jgi:adenosylmethionine-8-amino-7-oxononanoate aminotransferase